MARRGSAFIVPSFPVWAAPYICGTPTPGLFSNQAWDVSSSRLGQEAGTHACSLVEVLSFDEPRGIDIPMTVPPALTAARCRAEASSHWALRARTYKATTGGALYRILRMPPRDSTWYSDIGERCSKCVRDQANYHHILTISSPPRTSSL